MAREQSFSQSPSEAMARNSHEVSPIEPSSPRGSSIRENTTTTPGAVSNQTPPQRENEGEASSPPLPTRPANVANQQQSFPQQSPQQQQQPRMPYAPYPYPPQSYQYTQPVRMLPKQSQRYIGTKLGLTVLSSVLSIIIIALSGVLLSDSGVGDATAYYAIPIAVAAIIWNTAELITYCARLRRETQRGIHPGAHVALHLLFWLACVFAVLITVTLYIAVADTLAGCTESSDDDDDSYEDRYTSSYRYRYCQQYTPIDYYYWHYLPTLRALVAMFILTLINHFVLFVLACIDTHKRNLLKPAGVVLAPQNMYYAAPPPQPGMMPMPYYQHPVQPVVFPQQAYVGAASAAAAPGQPMAQTPEAKQALQNHQSLYGFYAPAPMPVPVPAPAPTPAAVHAPAPLSPRQMQKAPASAQASASTPAPAEASSSSNEKAMPEQS
ncbi:hypothetical protein F5X96DRAFT_617483 [Biscogniauxia mediterranea]|nr:hypothetical protein F5X96DRAFT_617483 [Biscogniauxia mediterranea]